MAPRSPRKNCDAHTPIRLKRRENTLNDDQRLAYRQAQAEIVCIVDGDVPFNGLGFTRDVIMEDGTRYVLTRKIHGNTVFWYCKKFRSTRRNRLRDFMILYHAEVTAATNRLTTSEHENPIGFSRRIDAIATNGALQKSVRACFRRNNINFTLRQFEMFVYPVRI